MLDIPTLLADQFKKRCEALNMTPVEAMRDWLDNNPPPVPKTQGVIKEACPSCNGAGYDCSTCGGEGEL